MDQVVFNMSGEFPSGVSGAVELDFSLLEGTNCYCDAGSEDKIRAAIAALGEGPRLNWIDTGDYHYLTAVTAGAVREPFSLILADRHPDTKEPVFGGVLSCGGWVRTLLSGQPLLRRVLLLGTNPGLSSEFSNLQAVTTDPGDLPEDLPVYVSVDLDVLDPSYARTDWDQGTMTLDDLTSLLGKILGGRRLLGVDICGGLTTSKGATDADRKVNASSRRALLQFFSAFFD